MTNLFATNPFFTTIILTVFCPSQTWAHGLLEGGHKVFTGKLQAKPLTSAKLYTCYMHFQGSLMRFGRARWGRLQRSPKLHSRLGRWWYDVGLLPGYDVFSRLHEKTQLRFFVFKKTTITVFSLGFRFSLTLQPKSHFVQSSPHRTNSTLTSCRAWLPRERQMSCRRRISSQHTDMNVRRTSSASHAVQSYITRASRCPIIGSPPEKSLPGRQF